MRTSDDAHLLEVGGKAVHVLVVGQQAVCLCLEEVDVPDAQHGQQNRCILIQWSCAEVSVLHKTGLKFNSQFN